MSEPGWVVFDLDETIVDHDTFSRFLVHLLRRDPWRAVVAAVSLPVAGPLVLSRRWWATGASILLWMATVGRSQGRVDELVRAYVADLDVRSRCYPAALVEVRRHLDAGRRVAVITASAQILAAPICREIDPEMVVVGSQLTWRAGGLVAAHHCYGPAKAGHLRSLGAPVLVAYSDSASDLPMLALADEVVLVNTSTKVRQAVRAALGNTRSLRWVEWRQ